MKNMKPIISLKKAHVQYNNIVAQLLKKGLGPINALNDITLDIWR